jgi:ParB/RepB/Spo0J family partition protein
MAARLRDLGKSGRQLAEIHPSLIRIEKGFNPRQYTLLENREHLDALKLSIREMGVRVPLLVRWDVGSEQAILIDGECRLRACLELIKEGVEIKTVPVLQEQAANEADRLLLAITTNTGKPLSIAESGAAFRRLVAYGWEHEAIATKTGHTARYVREALELSDAPEEVKQMVSSGSVTPALARKTLKEKGDSAAAVLREKVTAAKAKGKKVAGRERDQSKTEKLLAIGDKLADAVLEENASIDAMERLAKQWRKARA